MGEEGIDMEEEEGQRTTMATAVPTSPAPAAGGKSVRFVGAPNGNDDRDREQVDDDFHGDGRGGHNAPRLAEAPTAESSDGEEEGAVRSNGDHLVASASKSTTDAAPIDESSSASAIDPPPSHLEKLRDSILTILDHPIKTYFGLVVLIVIIIDGAFFFFLLVGWQGMCSEPSRTDCEPRNYWYNVSIQILNGCFTYAATVTLPWRLANAANLWPWCRGMRRRKCDVGLDLYGLPTDEIWFHIPPRQRKKCIVLLLGNTFTQYANQTTRIIYYNYELSAELPGSFWTNVFFVSSMALAAAGGFIQLRGETRLRKCNPDTFPPGPVDLIKKYLPKWWREWWKRRKERRRKHRRRTDDVAEEEDTRIEEGGDDDEGVRSEEDRRTRKRDRIERSIHLLHKHSTARIVTFWTSLLSWWNNDRHSLGLWGL